MDKLRLDFFDVLGYLIPGTALLLAMWITGDPAVVTLDNLYDFISKISTNTLLSGIIVAYVMGFTLHFLGSWLYAKRYGKKIKRRDSISSDLSEYWALIREHGEKHLPILDRWQALKALSSNLAAFSLLAVALCLLKTFLTHCMQWAYLSPVFLVLFFAYSNRAKVFADYLDKDSFAVFESLRLKEKLTHH